MRKKKISPPSEASLDPIPLSKIFRALGDPGRIRVIRMLLETEEACCGEFETDVAKSTMSHHFKVLREAGLVQKRQEGTRQFNCLRKKEIEKRCPGLIAALRGARSPL
jgi:DNA-binding transcriptional ArsR family regulator